MPCLILVQHGNSLSKEEDPERPLSRKGKRDVEKLAEFLAEAGIRPESIFHSGKKRAMQTAEILSSALAPDKSPVKKEGLSPLDRIEIAAEAFMGVENNSMIVGHLPYLSRLASFLVTGEPSIPVVEFQQGGAVCLQRDDETRRWRVSWMVVPGLLEGHGFFK